MRDPLPKIGATLASSNAVYRILLCAAKVPNWKNAGRFERLTSDRPLDAEREARTEERRRHDTVVAQLTSKIPAIEAPQETTEASEPIEEEPERVESWPTTVGAQEGARRPWWHRWFVS